VARTASRTPVRSARPAHRRALRAAPLAVAPLAGVVALASVGLGGCAVVSAVQKAGHTVAHNRAVIDTFASELTGAPTTFAATYRTTGRSPVTVIYAARPPGDVAFRESGSAADGGLILVANPSGEYSCSPASSGRGWSCRKLGKANALLRNQILDLYTPGHWVTFLRGVSLAAGVVGHKVRSTHRTINGFPMRCLTLRGTIAGTSTICTTAQDILGYVKVASDATSFEITSYTTAPRPSLFRLPPGARITKSAH
jgi:hypothetical protein